MIHDYHAYLLYIIILKYNEIYDEREKKAFLLYNVIYNIEL